VDVAAASVLALREGPFVVVVAVVVVAVVVTVVIVVIIVANAAVATLGDCYIDSLGFHGKTWTC
jgi:hypothetical protein